MNGTIEHNHRNFLAKLDYAECALAVVDVMLKKGLSLGPMYHRYKKIVKVVNTTKTDYNMGVISILAEYYEDVIGKSERKTEQTSKSYFVFMVSGDFLGKLKRCMRFIKGILESLIGDEDEEESIMIEHETHNATVLNNIVVAGNSCHISETLLNNKESENLIKLQFIVTQFEKTDVSYGVKIMSFKMCKLGCGEKMKTYPDNSELVCLKCGFVMKIPGIIFEDSQFYSQEGQRSKHGQYDPKRHCRFWKQRIQAEENAVIKPECIQAISVCISQGVIINVCHITCEQIREYLKETGYTKYNDHVPLIRKMITGISPPLLTTEETRMLYNLFDKAVYVYDMVKPSNKSNTMYYPYIIYKILDYILDEGMRKKQILECIHLQSSQTLISNDNLWEKICDSIPVDYKPTDRNEQLISF